MVFAWIAIVDDPSQASNLTARGNLVGMVTKELAVLGLANTGPLALKPSMEGKAVWCKEFAGINVFDIEVEESKPDKFGHIVASLEQTSGRINLQDFKTP